jgi:hypothetical protein
VTSILQALAKPLLYLHITLQHRPAVLALADTFVAFGFADETPARWTRSFLIGSHESGPSELEDLNALIALVTYATGLIDFSMTRRSIPPSVLAVLQHPGRSKLKHLGAGLCINVPSTVRHISRFHGLQELRLWLPKIDNVDELIEDNTAAWTLPCLAVLDVRLEDSDLSHEQELLGSLVRCPFARLTCFSWINFDFVAPWETQAQPVSQRAQIKIARPGLLACKLWITQAAQLSALLLFVEGGTDHHSMSLKVRRLRVLSAPLYRACHCALALTSAPPLGKYYFL